MKADVIVSTKRHLYTYDPSYEIRTTLRIFYYKENLANTTTGEVIN